MCGRQKISHRTRILDCFISSFSSSFRVLSRPYRSYPVLLHARHLVRVCVLLFLEFFFFALDIFGSPLPPACLPLHYVLVLIACVLFIVHKYNKVRTEQLRRYGAAVATAHRASLCFFFLFFFSRPCRKNAVTRRSRNR